MAVSSGSLPIFEETCVEWLRRLDADSSEKAHELRMEARGLANELRPWRTAPPQDDVRVGTIKRVLDFHRRAHEYATRGKP